MWCQSRRVCHNLPADGIDDPFTIGNATASSRVVQRLRPRRFGTLMQRWSRSRSIFSSSRFDKGLHLNIHLNVEWNGIWVFAGDRNGRASLISGERRRVGVGSGARAEKIRTYNFKDNRVTDHRLKMNFELTSFLDGNIETAVQSCATMEQKELLEELADSVGSPAR